ncbi:MAG: hypothetical protein BWY15_02036 [Firmicutes bacterium ADurb.Bin193]|nr:MAG: hypothetical protein BWY15_02036 [Firmicutes bacterium ADurb.Bin193]
MNVVKPKLKSLGITLSECAKKLMISRPTLDSYIDLYEKGQQIPQEKYQLIFDRLFSNEIFDKETFLAEVDSIHFLIERDQMLGTLELNPQKTDIITSVIAEMKNDMSEADCNLDIYIFVNMLIRSYRKNPIFQNLANYFLVLNGQTDINNINDDEKRFFSNCYKLFHEELTQESETDNEYLEKFYKRVESLNLEKQRQMEDLKTTLSNKISERISELTKLGINPEDISIDELMENMK